MKRIVLKYGLVIIAVLVSGGVLMDVSQRVQSAERKVARNDRALDQMHENLRVLRAEWAYLNDPARLEALAARGLGMTSPDVTGLVSSTDILPFAPSVSSSSLPSASDDSVRVKSPLYVEISESSSNEKRGGQR